MLVVGRADMAMLLGISPARVSQLVAQGMPAVTSGTKGRRAQFDAVACLAWSRERQESVAAAQGDETLRDEQLRWQIRKLRQEVRQRDGELVEASTVESRWTAMVISARERLLALPAVALRRKLIAADAEEALIGLVDEALRDLSARRTHAERA